MTEIPLAVLPHPPLPREAARPGDMWLYPPGYDAGRECWWITLPNLRGDAVEVSWRTTDRSCDPPHEMWDVSGTPPLLTVSPSIDVEYWRMVDGKPIRAGSYWHGWIRDGMLSQA